MDVNIVRIVSGNVLTSNIITCNNIMKDSFTNQSQHRRLMWYYITININSFNWIGSLSTSMKIIYNIVTNIHVVC